MNNNIIIIIIIYLKGYFLSQFSFEKRDLFSNNDFTIKSIKTYIFYFSDFEPVIF